MKRTKAVKSASDTSLRASATSEISKGSAFRSIKKRGSVDPKKVAAEINKKGDKNSGGKTEPISIKSERIATDKMAGGKGSSRVGGSQFNTTEKRNGPTNVSSTRVYPNKPKAVDGPKKALPAPKASSKASKSGAPKRERTRTVFVAEPVVNLNEGPGFGSTTHSISKTKMPAAPKPPKGKKNA
jgi:hypothetical protein